MSAFMRCACFRIYRCFNFVLLRKHASTANITTSTTCIYVSRKVNFMMSLVGRNFDIKRNSSSYTWRSHTCGELRSSHVGEVVTLCGWIQFQRMGKFVTLRDGYGAVQLIADTQDMTLGKTLNDLPFESVVQIQGKVLRRPDDQRNPKMATGDIEVLMENAQVLNCCKPDVPFSVRDFHKVRETLRLQYRYIDLRRSQLQHNLRLRSHLVMKIRDFLCNQQDFVDVETPTLFRRTPGGAQEFIVPTQLPGRFYSLTQSPQQFKQLLMIGGLDRYFQIAKCYRDESTLPHRQPEFTQVDIEMSFCTSENIRKLVEDLFKYFWPHHLDLPFKTMTYKEAIQMYGTDKPDTRYDMKLRTISKLLKGQGVKFIDAALEEPHSELCAIVVPQGLNHIKESNIELFQQIAKDQYGLKGILPIYIKPDLSWKSAISKHVSPSVQLSVNQELYVEPSSLLLLCAGPSQRVYSCLGKLRERCATALIDSGMKLYSKPEFQFLWVVDFPLLLPKVEGGVESGHHPFTAPHPDDMELLYSDPLKVRSQHYDLVLNGQEVGGGSIRIHDASLQHYILQTILKEDIGELQHLLDALQYGCPPHGGIALGLDRLMSIVCGADSIRDVIAFPKSADGKDPMSGAPAPISDLEKKLYHISIVDNNK